MSPQEPEGDAQGSPFPPPFKWGAARPAPKPARQRPEGPRPEPPVVVAEPTVAPIPAEPATPPTVAAPRLAAPEAAPQTPAEPVIPAPTAPAISSQSATPSADTEFGAPPVSPPWLAPEPAAGHDQQSAPGSQSVALAVLIGVLVLVVAGAVAFVVL
ncbi:hypothetical protein ABIC28_001671 [Rhodococcus sp. PvR044]|uniref:hypothetical protein n=1 Tax=Rhodococcus sp. PvR044 TaxID=3156402 RepID=UPI003399D8C7